ncbi:MAG: hypothetical protein WCP97_06955 [bacterium]
MNTQQEKRQKQQLQQTMLEEFFHRDVHQYLSNIELDQLDHLITKESQPEKAINFLFRKIPQLPQLLSVKQEKFKQTESKTAV